LHDHDDASLLADNPSCSASGAVQENDVITMTCSITYSDEIVSIFEHWLTKPQILKYDFAAAVFSHNLRYCVSQPLMVVSHWN